MTRVCATLATACGWFAKMEAGVALVHESALMGWGIDSNVVLPAVDALIVDEEDFGAFGVQPPPDWAIM